ncbi:MAG: TraB/GumN family protein, partial [Desulfatitalea sp.]
MHPIRRVCHLLLIALLAAHLCMPALPCPADIYRWQDEQGHWHFSDSPPSDAPIQQPPAPAYEAPARPSSSPLQGGIQPPVSSPSDESFPAPADAPGKTPLQEGLLWRVAKNGTAPSHLLGTIHSADPRVVRLRPAVQSALDRSDRFVMEMELESAAMTDFGASMLLTDGSDLEALLGATL